MEGSKGLFRPRERESEDDIPKHSRLPVIYEIEDGIARFDREQKLGYITPLDGPQRVRGLAGSGKTVILAMKAALTHLREPNAKISFTFHTKSLYQHIKRLITRFYRHFDDRDPDWDNLIIQHAWGGKSFPGVYYRACVAHGVSPMNLGQAKRAGASDVFSYVCKSLLGSVSVQPVYDYIFIDEVQDFDENFLLLCMRLAKKNRVIWGADELQNIFQTTSTSFGQIKEAATKENPLESDGLAGDWVLKVCYRTPREVLVCAHAMGFGFYGRMVQFLENKEHWEDLGYEVSDAKYIDGTSQFMPGTKISITRPIGNSPKFSNYKFKLDEVVGCTPHEGVESEVLSVVNKISALINDEKIDPTDIMVVCADDRNVGPYFDGLSSELIKKGVKTSNTQADRYGVRDFFEEGRVTLSTVHKAKGNEAYFVFIIGIDAVFFNPTPRERNIIFTAMTRTKGWLSISGVGGAALEFDKELNEAKAKYPNFEFELPSDTKWREIKRDLDYEAVDRVNETLNEIQGELPLDDMERALAKKLAEIRRIKNENKKF